MCVPPVLVQRCKSQFHSLPCGVQVILGLNGYIWVHKKFDESVGDENDASTYYSDVNDVSLFIYLKKKVDSKYIIVGYYIGGKAGYF